MIGAGMHMCLPMGQSGSAIGLFPRTFTSFSGTATDHIVSMGRKQYLMMEKRKSRLSWEIKNAGISDGFMELWIQQCTLAFPVVWGNTGSVLKCNIIDVIQEMTKAERTLLFYWIETRQTISQYKNIYNKMCIYIYIFNMYYGYI